MVKNGSKIRDERAGCDAHSVIPNSTNAISPSQSGDHFRVPLPLVASMAFFDQRRPHLTQLSTVRGNGGTPASSIAHHHHLLQSWMEHHSGLLQRLNQINFSIEPDPYRSSP